MKIGPPVSELIHYIKQCPPDFLKAPVLKGQGEVYTEALVNDIWRFLRKQTVAPAKIDLKADQRSSEELLLIQICCWLATHPFFAGVSPEWFESLVHKGFKDVAGLVKPELWLSDEERAEELSRIVLREARVVPEGESKEEAEDRLDSVDTVKRRKVLEESKAAIERAREIRRRMAEAKAREAANVYGRE